MISSERDQKRLQIFYRLRELQEFAGLSVTSQTGLICPLCWTEKDILDFTLEHIVPKALKGRRVTLTCSDCNSTAGKILDHHLVEQQRIFEAFQGLGDIGGELAFNDTRLAVRLSRDLSTPSTDFHIVEKATCKADITDSKQKLESGEVREMKLRFDKWYSKRLRQIALLKSAYLAVFHRFGYRAAKESGLQQVRQLIQSRAVGQIPDLSGITGEFRDVPDYFKNSQYSIVAAQFGKQRFLWVILKCRLRSVVFRFVMLPIHEIGIDTFAALAKHAAENPEFQFNLPEDAPIYT